VIAVALGRHGQGRIPQKHPEASGRDPDQLALAHQARGDGRSSFHEPPLTAARRAGKSRRAPPTPEWTQLIEKVRTRFGCSARCGRCRLKLHLLVVAWIGAGSWWIHPLENCGARHRGEAREGRRRGPQRRPAIRPARVVLIGQGDSFPCLDFLRWYRIQVSRPPPG